MIRIKKEFQNQETLDLNSTKVTDAGLEHLKGLTNLKHLGLNHTQIGDTGLGHLKGMTKLDTLILSNTKVTAQGIADLKKALPKCDIKWDGNTKPDSSK